jgi:hypothetical protein
VAVDLAIAHGSGRLVEGRAGNVAAWRGFELAIGTRRDLRHILVDSSSAGLALGTRWDGRL